MAKPFPAGAWLRFSRRANGWMMMDILLAMSLILLSVTALLPLVSHIVRIDKKAQIEEALLRQAVSLEETLFQDLSYGRDFSADSHAIQFKTPQGRKKGFIVHGDKLSVRLSDGTYQPLTGGVGTIKGGRILIQPYGSEPFFSREGRAVTAAFLLVEAESGLSLPFKLIVTSLNEENR